MPGSKKLESKKLKLILGTKKLRFAAPEEVKEIMHCEIGACYPFGSIIGLDTYMDNSLKNQSKISFNPGLHHKSIMVKLSDYLSVENPKILDIAKD